MLSEWVTAETARIAAEEGGTETINRRAVTEEETGTTTEAATGTTTAAARAAPQRRKAQSQAESAEDGKGEAACSSRPGSAAPVITPFRDFRSFPIITIIITGHQQPSFVE